MPQLAERQSGFVAAILDPGSAMPPGLVGPDGLPSPRRFAVYRNNVLAGLSDVLKAAYPATCRVVGEEFFRAMARPYVLAEPPRSPRLIEYGAGFADFIATFEPAATLPYLADVARIEWAWQGALHAAEAAPVPPAAIAAVPPERLPRLRLALHPSLRVCVSAYPALTIWEMNVGDGVPAPVDMSVGEDCLIARPGAEIFVRRLKQGGASFLARLRDDASLGEAAAATIEAHAGFNLAATLALMLSVGAVAGLSEGPNE